MAVERSKQYALWIASESDSGFLVIHFISIK